MGAFSAVPEQLRLFDGGIDLSALRMRREGLRSVDRALHTVEGYASDVRVFERWCALAGRQALPADTETLSLYVTWLLTDGKRRSATAIRHLAAIVDHHKRSGFKAPATTDTRELISAVKRSKGERPTGKRAITIPDLARAARKCNASTLLGARDRAILVLGFATSLRRSELCSLMASDITFDKRGLIVFLRRSKTDQHGRGRLICVWPGKRAATDPVRVLKAWLSKRGDWDGPLFCRIQTGDVLTTLPITGDSVIDAVKRAVRRIGLDPHEYGAHSLRAGAITAAAEMGRSDQEIMGLSGHADPKVMRMYVRRARAFSGRNPLAGAL